MNTVEHRPVLIVILVQMAQARLLSLQEFSNTNGWKALYISILTMWLRNVLAIGIHPKLLCKLLNTVRRREKNVCAISRALFLKLSFLLKVRSILFDVLMNLVTLFAFFSFLQIRMTNGKLFKLYIEDIPAWASSILSLT